MNQKMFFVCSILLASAIALSGCASGATPAATMIAPPVLTPEPLVCPTSAPQECPSPAVEAQVINEWRWGYTKDYANVVITFDPGDKCSLEFIKPTDGNELAFEIVVNDQTYQNYMVVLLSLDQGKGFKDLEAYNAQGGQNNGNPPPFSKVNGLEIVPPMSRTFHGVLAQTSPLYFVCLVQGPGSQRVIEEFDGIAISGQ